MRFGIAATIAVLAGPAAAEGVADRMLCDRAWTAVLEQLMAMGAAQVVGTTAQAEDGTCEITDLTVAMQGNYAPSWSADSLRVRGSALGWLLDRTGSPDRLELEIDNLRIAARTGNPQMDWIFAAQARANPIDAKVALTWDKATQVLQLKRLWIDFPGDNLIEGSARIGQVDLSSEGAAAMSLTGFTVTEADLRLRTHGLFEAYVLLPFGAQMLPAEGDLDAAAAGIRSALTAAVAKLPNASVPEVSKAALRALIGELPNPAGEATLSLRSEEGIGPARFAGYYLTEAPGAGLDIAPVLDGVTVAVDWRHGDAD